MRKADKIKLSVIVGVSLLAFVVGCVDTSVQSIPNTVNYNSEVAIVDLTVGTGTATISSYGSVVDQDSLATNVLTTKYDWLNKITGISGNMTMGSTLPADGSFLTVPSGKKAFVVTYTGIAAADTFQLSMVSNYKERFYLVGDTGQRQLIAGTQRYIWQTPGSTEGATLFPSGSGWLEVFNGSPDGTISVDVQDAATDSSYDAADVAFSRATAGYFQLPSGKNYNLIVTAGSTVDTVAFAPVSLKRYTAIVYNNAASLQIKVLTDD
jgi:hypothetical protein